MPMEGEDDRSLTASDTKTRPLNQCLIEFRLIHTFRLRFLAPFCIIRSQLREVEMIIRSALAVACSFFFVTGGFAQSLCGVKNQTPKEVTDRISADRSIASSLGSCVFLVSAPEKGIRQYRKTAVGQLSYDDCARRGEDAVAFKWYPDSVMTLQQVEQQLTGGCGGPCEGFPPICPGICYCVGATHCE
jgi:hypothetical protein